MLRNFAAKGKQPDLQGKLEIAAIERAGQTPLSPSDFKSRKP